MTITVLNDVIVPDAVIDTGVRGKNIRLNRRAQNQGGFESINILWSSTLRSYEIGIAPMSITAWDAIQALHEVTHGGAYGMLMSDPKDSHITSAQGLLYTTKASGAYVGTIGYGRGEPTMRLYRRYTSGSYTKDRLITRPKTSAVTLLRNASPVTLGASAGNAAINYDTGTVTFVADYTKAVTAITANPAYTQFDFADGLGLMAHIGVGDWIYLAGVTGAAAASLNNLSHQITQKNPTDFRVSTIIDPLTATGGTAYLYPQTYDVLSWSGDFYVPVHFANDYIDWQLERAGTYDGRLLSGPNITINEIREV